MSWRERVTWALVPLAIIATACGDASSTDVATSGGTQEFCTAWTAALVADDQPAFWELLADPPSELSDEAEVVRRAEATGEESVEVDAAARFINDWIALNCPGPASGANTRRVAPPLGTPIDGLKLCTTMTLPAPGSDDSDGMVIYGPTGSDDPYEGPMLALIWGPAEYGGHQGDGDSQPVTVRGRPGVAAPITVFQQVIVPELGTVVAWTEGDRAFGLYGRQWTIDQADELVDLANAVEDRSDRLAIPAEALPMGFGEVFSGSPGVTSLVFSISTYSLHFEGPGGGLLQLSGLQMSEAEFEASRFFTLDVGPATVGDREVLEGNAWSDRGPALVTWREPDGLVVRIVGLGVSLDLARTVAESSRELSDAEWAELVRAEDACGEFSP